jgi:hypothetical protein
MTTDSSSSGVGCDSLSEKSIISHWKNDGLPFLLCRFRVRLNFYHMHRDLNASKIFLKQKINLTKKTQSPL